MPPEEIDFATFIQLEQQRAADVSLNGRRPRRSIEATLDEALGHSAEAERASRGLRPMVAAAL